MSALEMKRLATQGPVLIEIMYNHSIRFCDSQKLKTTTRCWSLHILIWNIISVFIMFRSCFFDSWLIRINCMSYIYSVLYIFKSKHSTPRSSHFKLSLQWLTIFCMITLLNVLNYNMHIYVFNITEFWLLYNLCL